MLDRTSKNVLGLSLGLLSICLGWSPRMPPCRRSPPPASIDAPATATSSITSSPLALFSAMSDHELSDDHNRDKFRSAFDKNNTSSSNRAVQKKIRIARVQAKIDHILSQPDAPIDLEKELKKVVLMAPPEPQSAEVEQLDSHESELEQNLYQAARQQDMDTAARIKREISQLHIDDCGNVLHVNAQFYKAVSSKDFAHMATLWVRDGTASCIHPACHALVGTTSILDGWQHMFSKSANQKVVVEPHKIRLAVKGASTAIVTCEEHVFTRRFIPGQQRRTELVNVLVTTNIFRKVQGRWLIHHHHASWHPESRASKAALRALGIGGGLSSSQSDDSNNAMENPMNGIAGSLDPLLISSGKKLTGKRVIAMGSLSDLLNGNLGDILGKAGKGEGGAGMNNGIIRFTSKSNGEDYEVEETEVEEMGMSEDEDEEEEDDEGDDDDDDDEEEDDEDYEVQYRPVRTFLKQTDSRSPNRKKDDSNNNMITGAPKDKLRQECIGALRKLCDQGAISPKQKRVLITDIITCSKKGDFSLVEVAFELLYGETEDKDKDIAEEEFADQCRVLAQSLPDPLAPSTKQ